MRTITRSIIAALLVAACGKNVPLATTDAPAAATADAPESATADAPVIDPACDTPHQDGEPCSSPGLICVSHDSCGDNLSSCLGGVWSTSQCEQDTNHCPCVSDADCDPLSQCTAVTGICHPLLPTTPCGGAGEACCGGTCGSCNVGLSCNAGGTCEPSGGGTQGAACTLQCDGTSNCDPGQYCPESCATCPCSDTCHTQASICTLGNDESCDADPTMPSIYRHCVAGQGPFTTKCECLLPGLIDPVTGKCK